MNSRPSIILNVSPRVSSANKETIMTINGLNFIDGGDPLVFVADKPMKINSFSSTEIEITVPKQVGFGIHRLTVLNGLEQPK